MKKTFFFISMASMIVLFSSCSPNPDDANATIKSNIQATEQIPARGMQVSKKQNTDDRRYKFNQYSNLPAAIKLVFVGDDRSSDAAYKNYMRDIDESYFLLNNGQYDKAIVNFRAIEKETLFEIENIAAWSGHAAALCKINKKEAGRTKLNNARCSMQLMAHNETCSDLDINKDNIGSESGFPSECYAQMCEAQIIRPYYEADSSEKVDTKKMSKFRDHLNEIEIQCEK